MALKRFKIAILLGSFAAGGSERAMINFANGLAAQEFEVDLIAGPGPQDFRANVDATVNVIELKHGMLKSIPFLRRYLCNQEPGILFASQLHVNIVAILSRILNSKSKTKIILREATTPSQLAKALKTWREYGLMFLAKRLFHRAEHLIAAGEACRIDAVQYYGLDPEKTTTVYSSFTCLLYTSDAADE